jgi:hypothetical protein
MGHSALCTLHFLYNGSKPGADFGFLYWSTKDERCSDAHEPEVLLREARLYLGSSAARGAGAQVPPPSADASAKRRRLRKAMPYLARSGALEAISKARCGHWSERFVLEAARERERADKVLPLCWCGEDDALWVHF